MSQSENLTPQEAQIVALVNGTSIYNYDLELEKIALNRSAANYAFRAAGSSGANETANWIAKQFESFGLETYKESFQFTKWDLLSQPNLIIYGVSGQTEIQSFQSEHYSWGPTPQDGVFADLVVLPLPPATYRNEIGLNPINETEWSTINTTDKIVLIGREARWNTAWEETYKNKLTSQTPAAIVYTWWYNWTSFTPPVFGSAGGRPPTKWGPYYWNLNIPVGWVNYGDGLWIRNRENDINVSARISIQSVIGYGSHYNVVGKLRGQIEPNKYVIVSGHYDTVMDSGFCDNGAGTAGMVELARIFTHAARKGLHYASYTILFVAFTSEEIGLVGSINYVKQHEAEIKDVVAVINLDSIGSDNLQIEATEPSNAFDLDMLISKAAEDLGVNAMVTEIGDSDHEVFKNPAWADGTYKSWWNSTAGISDATPVKASTMLASSPLLYSDIWRSGKPGWIHTSYDNSTSTQTLGWVKPDNLQNHVRVAALSLLRISASTAPAPSPIFPWWILGTLSVGVGIATAIVLYLKRVRKPPINQHELPRQARCKCSFPTLHN